MKICGAMTSELLFHTDVKILLACRNVPTPCEEEPRRFWRLLSWSLGCLAAGVWPSCNMEGVAYPSHTSNGRLAGKLLAGGWRGMVCAVIGDLEFHASGYGLQNPNSGAANMTYPQEVSPARPIHLKKSKSPHSKTLPGTPQMGAMEPLAAQPCLCTFSSGQPCSKCKCVSSMDMPWTDIRT